MKGKLGLLTAALVIGLSYGIGTNMLADFYGVDLGVVRAMVMWGIGSVVGLFAAFVLFCLFPPRVILSALEMRWLAPLIRWLFPPFERQHHTFPHGEYVIEKDEGRNFYSVLFSSEHLTEVLFFRTKAGALDGFEKHRAKYAALYEARRKEPS